MGLFSRKDSSSASGTRAGSRPSVSSEVQARELRVRARRRLVGALALVLAAVIVVPMLFDSDDMQASRETPVVVPMVVTPSSDAPLLPDVASGASGGGLVSPTPPAAQPDASTVTTPPAPPQPDTAAPVAAAPTTTPGQTTPASPPATTPHTGRDTAAAPVTPPAGRDAPPARPAQTPPAQRTDDGALALALLEGRKPVNGASRPATAQQQGNFVVQIAAYTTQQDAAARRDKLIGAGVTNAFVETAQASGKTTYRLRVGPFSTREAAQAAQARIRALGDYKDAFITAK